MELMAVAKAWLEIWEIEVDSPEREKYE